MVNTILRRVTVPLALAGLIFVAGLSLNRIYNGQLLLALIVGAALASILVSSLGRRAPAWVVAPLSVAALAGYALYAVQVSAQAGAIAGDLRTVAIDATRNAVPRLLTALIPIEPQPDTVLAPVVLAWLAGFAGAELAERSRRAALGLIPPTVLYAGALVLVGPNTGVVVWQPLAFAALAAMALLASGAVSGARSEPDAHKGGAHGGDAHGGDAHKGGAHGGDACQGGAHRGVAATLRPATGLAVGLVAVLTVVGIVAPIVTGAVSSTPVDPRRYVVPPSLDVLDENPLVRVAGWAADPSQRLFTVDVLQGASRPPAGSGPTLTPTPSDLVVVPADDPGAAGDGSAAELPDVGAYDTRLRLAVLEEWDGVTWHMSTEYRNAGRVLPPVADPPGAADEAGSDGRAAPQRIEELITVDELQGRLMPAVSAPHRVDGVRVAFDQATGTLLLAEPLAPGVSYSVTSINHSVDVDLLPAADVPSGPALARLLAVGDTVPADLTALADKIAAGEGSPYLKALNLETFLAEHYRIAADAPSGHAYPNLRFFLFDPVYAGGQRGTSEQFATAFATLGRLMGLPTRVVVGFHTPAGGGTVTGADGLAWPEVLFDGVGWVAFDPMPDPATPPRDLEDEYLPKPTPPTTPPDTVEPSAPATSAPAAVPSQTLSASTVGVAVGVVAGGVGGGILVALMVFLAAVVLLRYLRTRGRLGRSGPPQRVLGAWDEVLDALQLAGAPPPAHLAVEEVAAYAAEVAEGMPARRHARRPRPAAPPLDDLAAKVNAVGFGFSAGTDAIAAHTATVQAVEYARALRARRSWWRRLLWVVDPRPLRRSR
jgi:transglutaminase-like putative cysteine protease